MSSYQRALPSLFPFAISVTPTYALVAIEWLLSDKRSDNLQGSSFALTVDNYDDTVNLWLSRTSYEYLKSQIDTLNNQVVWNQDEFNDTMEKFL